jgi:hypothetical protein
VSAHHLWEGCHQRPNHAGLCGGQFHKGSVHRNRLCVV